jgi:predicted GIY-YIG superfamily endonuclease
MRSHRCVYVFRDAEGQVLYVGLSVRIADRLARHSRRKDWWEQATSIELVHCESYEEMVETETRLIRELGPRHNVHKNTRERERRMPLEGWEVAEVIPTDDPGVWTVTYLHPEHDRPATSSGVRASTAEEAAERGLERWLSFARSVNAERDRKRS